MLTVFYCFMKYKNAFNLIPSSYTEKFAAQIMKRMSVVLVVPSPLTHPLTCCGLDASLILPPNPYALQTALGVGSDLRS